MNIFTAKGLRPIILKEEAEENGEEITLNIPLFIRLMEFAREDAKDDMILHKIAEKASEMMEDNDCLEMEHYSDLVKG